VGLPHAEARRLATYRSRRTLALHTTQGRIRRCGKTVSHCRLMCCDDKALSPSRGAVRLMGTDLEARVAYSRGEA
jgi:hypothetical protein